MSTECSNAPVIAWNWVIQSLANFKQVDSSTLVGLVKSAPAISDDLGKDAREMVSLQILENLFVHENEATVDTDSAKNAKMSFDPSEHCEDVFHKILDEIPWLFHRKTSEPMTELERQKWNVHPFIMQKRSSLPKSPLQKLKEALLEGTHPFLTSLKERSKLGVANKSEDTSPVVDINFNAQTTVAKVDLLSLNPENGNNEFQESLLQKSDELENSTRGIAENIGRKECEMSVETPVRGLDETKLMDHSEDAVSKKLEQSCDDADTKHGQQQPPGNDDNLPQDAYREGQDKRVLIDSMNNLESVGKFGDPKNDILPNVSNSGPSSAGKQSMENDAQLVTGMDGERSDEERNHIGAKKEAFLSSQCPLSQDSMAMTDSMEISVCMKCNEGGQLLVCCSDSCLTRVHESCLGSAATLDEDGNFFCPFCAYSRAISQYLEAKKKASFARKGLQAFLSIGVEYGPKISSTKEAGLDKNESRPIGALGETIEVNGNGDTVSRGNNINCFLNKEDCAPAEQSSGGKRSCVSNAENSARAGPSRLCVNNELHFGHKGVSIGNRSLREAKEMGQELGEACQSPTRIEGRQPTSKKAMVRAYHLVGEHADIRLNNACLNQPTTDSLQKPIHPHSMPKQDYNKKESPLSSVSGRSRRACKRKPQYTSPAVPLLGRKQVQWTKPEEEILKEGVLRFSSDNSKGIPWRQILDFGRDVFHKGRTAIDLKDKWRNIYKRSAAPKKPKL